MFIIDNSRVLKMLSRHVEIEEYFVRSKQWHSGRGRAESNHKKCIFLKTLLFNEKSFIQNK